MRGYRFPNIAQWMYQNDVTMTEMARRMQVSQGSLSNLLRGKADPRLYTVCAVLRATGMTFEEAFEEGA